MSIWHSVSIGSGGQTGRFTPFPRRDRISADGSMVKTPGFTITMPRNGILDTDKFNSNEKSQAELAAGPDWEKKLDEHIKLHAKTYGLAPGLPGHATDAKEAIETAKVKIVEGARSAASVK